MATNPETRNTTQDQVDTGRSEKVLTPEEQRAAEELKAKENLERSEKTKKALEAQLWKLETLTSAGWAGRDILIRTLNQMIEKKGIDGVSFWKMPDGKIVPNVKKDGMNSLEQVNFIVTGAEPTEKSTTKQPDAFIDVNGDGQYIKWQDIGYFQWGKVEWTLDANGNVLDTGAKKDGRNVGEMNLSPEWHQLYKVSNNGYFRDINTFITTFGKQLGIPDASLSKLKGGSVVWPDDKWIISFQKWVPGKWTLEQQWVSAVNSPKMPGNKQIDITSFMEALQAQEAPKPAEQKPTPAENKEVVKPTGEFGRFYMDGGAEHYDIPDDADVTYKKAGNGGESVYKWSEIELTAENLAVENSTSAKFKRIPNGDSMILIGESKDPIDGIIWKETNPEKIKSLLAGKWIEAWEVKKEWGKASPEQWGASEQNKETTGKKVTITEIGDTAAHSMSVVNSSERWKDKSHPIRMEKGADGYSYSTQEWWKEESKLTITEADLEAIKKDPKAVPESIKKQITESLQWKKTPLISGESLHLQIPNKQGEWQQVISIKKWAKDELSIETTVSTDPRINFPAMKSISADKKTMTLHSIGGQPEINVRIENWEVQVIGKDKKPYKVELKPGESLTDFFKQDPKQALRSILSAYKKSGEIPPAGEKKDTQKTETPQQQWGTTEQPKTTEQPVDTQITQNTATPPSSDEAIA